MDFGISRQFRQGALNHDRANTPLYCPPELILREGYLPRSFRTRAYSGLRACCCCCCCCCCLLLAAHLPHMAGTTRAEWTCGPLAWCSTRCSAASCPSARSPTGAPPPCPRRRPARVTALQRWDRGCVALCRARGPLSISVRAAPGARSTRRSSRRTSPSPAPRGPACPTKPSRSSARCSCPNLRVDPPQSRRAPH
jgi:hypothetical protein